MCEPTPDHPETYSGNLVVVSPPRKGTRGTDNNSSSPTPETHRKEPNPPNDPPRTVVMMPAQVTPPNNGLIPPAVQHQWNQFQAFMSGGNGGSSQATLTEEGSEVCGTSDIRCLVTRQNLPAPPTAVSQSVAQIQEDPGTISSDCSSWEFFRGFTRRFKQMLKDGVFGRDAFTPTVVKVPTNKHPSEGTTLTQCSGQDTQHSRERSHREREK